jgi:hypothetical protein
MRLQKRSQGRGCVAKKLEIRDEKGYGKEKDDHRGEGEWVIWEQEKGSRKAMDIIQGFSVQSLVHHVIVLLKMCSNVFVLQQPMYQRPLGLERTEIK